MEESQRSAEIEVDEHSARQAPGDVPREALIQALDAIERHFGRGWLRGAGTPLQDAWNRNDLTATIELFWFGSSLLRIEKIDGKWLNDHVNHIKVGARNEKIGSIFEILLLAMFNTDYHAVLPAKHNQPGYDAILGFPNGNIGYLSLKNFAKTKFQVDFEYEAARLYETILKTKYPVQRDWTGVIAISDAYAKKDDWEQLGRFVAERLLDNSLTSVGEFIGIWHVRKTTPPATAKLRSGYQSLTVQFICRQHENERLNIDTSLEKAMVGFNKNVNPSAQDRSSNILLVRLREDASIDYHATWTKNYLERVSTKLDEVIFYQPAISHDRINNIVGIVHHMTVLAVGPNRHPTAHFEIPIGRVHNVPTKRILQFADRELPIDDYHLFQRGQIYHVAGTMEIGKELPLLLDFGAGIIAHNVTSLFSPDNEMIMSPRHPLTWSLSLLND